MAYSDCTAKEVRYCSDRKEERITVRIKAGFLGSSLKDGDRVIMIEDVDHIGEIHGGDGAEGERRGGCDHCRPDGSLNRMEVEKTAKSAPWTR